MARTPRGVFLICVGVTIAFTALLWSIVLTYKPKEISATKKRDIIRLTQHLIEERCQPDSISFYNLSPVVKEDTVGRFTVRGSFANFIKKQDNKQYYLVYYEAELRYQAFTKSDSAHWTVLRLFIKGKNQSLQQ